MGYRAADHKQIAPCITTLINGVGWQSGFPRTMTNRDIQQLIVAAPAGETRLAAVQDVSCDLKVSPPQPWIQCIEERLKQRR